MKRAAPRFFAPAALAGVIALAGCTDRDPLSAGPEAAPAARADHITARAGKGGKHVAGQVIVKLREGARIQDVAVRGRGRLKRQMTLDRTFIINVPEGEEEAIAAQLASDPDVEWAEADYVVQLVPCEVGECQEINDSFRGYKWDLHNTGFIDVQGSRLGTTGKADSDIDWQEMYDYLGPNYQGSAVIGIIDSGIRKGHGDLLGKVIGERNFITTDSTQRGNADDDNGHGTHVAGIATAGGNNGRGVMGVAYGPNFKLLAGKACNSAGSCPNSATAEAIIWAVDNGANVINLSFGGFGSTAAGSSAHLNALRYAESKNVLVVCSTGNDARKTDPATNNPVYVGGISYPARFSPCMAVGSTNYSDTWAGYSNWGPQMSVAAPGGDTGTPGGLGQILSVGHTSNTIYSFKYGTSMAAPQVTGLAAVLYSLGITDRAEIRRRIEQTADDIDTPGHDWRTGHGRINAYRAVTLKDPYAPPVVETGGSYTGTEGSPIRFDGSASSDPNGKPVTFEWSFGDGATSTAASPEHTFADDGSYTVTLKVTDQSGRSTTSTTVATVANAAPRVSASVSDASVSTGGSVSLSGSFSDAGVNDAAWGWTIDWGNGTSTGTAVRQSDEITGTQRFCAAGTYTVRLSVTDKDGGTGSDAATVTVSALAVRFQTPGSINAGANGKLPVKVLSTASFDATSIDPATVTLGDGEGSDARVVRKNNGALMASSEDVNGDGRADLVLHFERSELNDIGGGVLVLGGTLGDGCRQVRGSETVRVH